MGMEIGGTSSILGGDQTIPLSLRSRPPGGRLAPEAGVSLGRDAFAPSGMGTYAFTAPFPRAVPPAPEAPAASKPAPPAAVQRRASTGVGIPSVGYDRSNLDPTVRPQDDFHQYAAGGYLARSPIPGDRPSWGVDAELVQQTQGRLKDILEALATGCRPPSDSSGSACESEESGACDARSRMRTDDQRLGDFYASGMDQAAIDAAGIRPLRPLLAGIHAVQDRSSLLAMTARLHASGLGAMFHFGPGQDAKSPDDVIGETFQGGLGLPERDYYFKDDDDGRRIRDAYVAHVGRIFELAGRSPSEAAAAAQTVMAVETRLADASVPLVDLRDPNALYNIHDRSQLAALAPHLDWDTYLAGVGQANIQQVNVATPSFFEKLDRALTEVPVEDWKTYLEWQVLHQTAPYLSSGLEQEAFAFSSGVLKGVTQQLPRWKRVVAWTDEMMGEALGRKFVEKHFPPAARARALEMVDNIKLALREKMAGLDWMSDDSKTEALAKVDRLVAKIGYPDTWTDYSALRVDRGVFGDNVLRALEFAADRSYAKIGKPVDRGEWEMTPSTVNAYFHPQKNEIVFPAAILQPPYFDLAADDAANYGATGATIGHELTHGFDDEGAQFDSQGRLRNWWQPADLERFKALADGVERQFSEFSYDGQQVNGALVKGESIADLGGLELAWAAFQRARASRPEPSTDDGFTPEQRFFLSYALSWATSLRPEYAHLILSTDPHPLPKFRVLGPLANMPAFHRAFGVREGDAMMRPPEKRNRLWDAASETV